MPPEETRSLVPQSLSFRSQYTLEEPGENCHLSSQLVTRGHPLAMKIGGSVTTKLPSTRQQSVPEGVRSPLWEATQPLESGPQTPALPLLTRPTRVISIRKPEKLSNSLTLAGFWLLRPCARGPARGLRESLPARSVSATSRTGVTPESDPQSGAAAGRSPSAQSSARGVLLATRRPGSVLGTSHAAKTRRDRCPEAATREDFCGS